MYVRLTQPYLVVSRCDTMEKKGKNSEKLCKKCSENYAYFTVIYLYIPANPQYGYVVCQNLLPYPYLHYPFWKHCGFFGTCAKPYIPGTGTVSKGTGAVCELPT